MDYGKRWCQHVHASPNRHPIETTVLLLRKQYCVSSWTFSSWANCKQKLWSVYVLESNIVKFIGCFVNIKTGSRIAFDMYSLLIPLPIEKNVALAIGTRIQPLNWVNPLTLRSILYCWNVKFRTNGSRWRPGWPSRLAPDSTQMDLLAITWTWVERTDPVFSLNSSNIFCILGLDLLIIFNALQRNNSCVHQLSEKLLPWRAHHAVQTRERLSSCLPVISSSSRIC